MYGDFDDNLLMQWCELYDRFVTKDRQRLAATLTNCSSKKLQHYLLPISTDIAAFLATAGNTDEDFLTAYGHLRVLDERFWKKALPPDGFIEKNLNGSRYILIRAAQHPIAKAIPENKHLKLDDELGTHMFLQLHHHWQEVYLSIELELRISNVFDTLVDASLQHMKIGMSPFAGDGDMQWRHDSQDGRGVDGRLIPFWCEGAKDEDALWNRLSSVLESAREQHVHVLLFPELVMTETLQKALSEWLEKYNAFEPVIRLIVAGTRHVIDANGSNVYSNRCTVFNHIGDIEWEQDKCQPFHLTAKDADKFFGIQSPVFEPTQLAQRLVMRHTALGRLASPICLDFLCDKLWKLMPVDVFFVPAMSPNLKRFSDNSRVSGSAWGSAVFVCNAQPDQKQKAVLAYRPAKNDALQPEEKALFLFTVDVDIDMN